MATPPSRGGRSAGAERSPSTRYTGCSAAIRANSSSEASGPSPRCGRAPGGNGRIPPQDRGALVGRDLLQTHRLLVSVADQRRPTRVGLDVADPVRLPAQHRHQVVRAVEVRDGDRHRGRLPGASSGNTQHGRLRHARYSAGVEPGIEPVCPSHDASRSAVAIEEPLESSGGVRRLSLQGRHVRDCRRRGGCFKVVGNRGRRASRSRDPKAAGHRSATDRRGAPILASGFPR